jgi:uncharacterized protein (TIGR00730 family)
MTREPATPDEELLEAEVARVLTTETDASRVARMESELREGFAALATLGPAVSVFGSARTPEGHADYLLAREVARRLGDAGLAIITGGGPGTMEAANRGARDAGARSVGLKIDLPFEQHQNRHIDLPIEFHYFFTRKVMFVRYAGAFVVFPGGFGTLDEVFEALTLIQTEKIRHFPVVLVGSDYWDGLLQWLRRRVLAEGNISPEDVDLLRVVDDADAVLEAIRPAFEWRAGSPA